jgi:histidine ammonia-lyase
MNPLVIKGSGLTVENVVDVARNGRKVELSPDALERIKICRAMLERKINAHEIMYGVNTGIGEFSEIVLDDDQVKDFQKYLGVQLDEHKITTYQGEFNSPLMSINTNEKTRIKQFWS